MNKPEKFMFNTPFEGGARAQSMSIEERIAASLREEFETEREEIRQLATEQGIELGRREALASVENQTCEALNQIVAQSKILDSQFSTRLQEIREEAVELAVSSALKLAGDVLTALPSLSLEQILQEVFSQLRSVSHISITAPESLVETLHPKIAEISESRGYKGEIIVTGSPDLELGDCRVEWSDGGIAIDRKQIANLIGNAVERSLNDGLDDQRPTFRSGDPDQELTDCAEFIPEQQSQLVSGYST